MPTYTEYKKDLAAFMNNPSGIQRTQIRLLREARGGEFDVVDASNPFIYLLESGAQTTAALLDKYEALDRRRYPIAAQTQEDLYLHMSDVDYLDRFAQPVSAKFDFFIARDEILNKAILDPETGYRKIVMPRGTRHTVGGVTFWQGYPIEIRVMDHNAIRVVYDATETLPFEELESNIIETDERMINGQMVVRFSTNTLQYSIDSTIAQVTPGSPLVFKKAILDQFFYLRVYQEQADLSWQEIRVTHSDLIYDPNVLTAVAKVDGQNISVSVPQIYATVLGLMGNFRVDIYQTKGPLNMDLRVFTEKQITTSFETVDPADQTPYTAVLESIQAISVIGMTFINGGRDMLSLEELRRRVIAGSTGPKNKPITPDQIQTALVDKGYEIVKNIDSTTNRVFLGTRALPRPTQKELITAASLSVQMSIFSIAELVLLQTVIDNQTSVTITPETVFQNRDGRAVIVPKSEIDALRAMTPDEQAFRVSSANYYYTPWYYVLDAQESEFDFRAYHLDAPMNVGRSFVRANDTTRLTLGTLDYSISKVAQGYRILIKTQSDDVVKNLPDEQLQVQLAFVPIGEQERAYLNGTLIGVDPSDNERVYEFIVATNHNVTAGGGLQLTNFVMFEDVPQAIEVALLAEFEVFYCTTAFVGTQYERGFIEQAMGAFILPADAKGITHERLKLRLGYSLDRLWKQSRTITGEESYERYAEDVYAVYEEDEYQIVNPATGSTWEVVDGELKRTLLHAKGTEVLDPQGNRVIQFYKGDTVKDAYGRPIVKSGRSLYRQLDFMLVEGAYYFATDPVAAEYRLEMVQMLLGWITEDLTSIVPSLLEKTEIFLYPKTTTGPVRVTYGPGLSTTLNAEQGIVLDISVTDTVYANDTLKAQLLEQAVLVINSYFQLKVVAVSDIIVALRKAFGSDVIDVRVKGLGGANDFSVLTVESDTQRLSLAKRLAARADGVLVVEEDVTANFIRHTGEAV